MKVCTKCKIEKELSEFTFKKNIKSNLRSDCKECCKKYALKNKETIQLRSKSYKKQYTINNKDKLKIKNKEYRDSNKEKIKQWIISNKKNLNDKANKYQKNRKLIDPLFKLSCNLRTLIYNSIKRQGYTKKSKTYEILGCTYEEFKQHLESKFTEGMTWSNQGQWHMDHIYPVSRAIDEEHIIKLNHYTNFQPLWAEDNFKKSNKY